MYVICVYFRLIFFLVKYWKKETNALDSTLETLRVKMIEIKQKKNDILSFRKKLKQQLKMVKSGNDAENTCFFLFFFWLIFCSEEEV